MCNTVGHIAAVCKKSKPKSSNFLNTEQRNSNAHPDDELMNLFHTNKNSSHEENRFTLALKVNNINITFEIDTGAAVSVCSKELYNQHFSTIPLEQTNIVLKSYDNSVIRPCGRFTASVQHKSSQYDCEFLVIQNGGRPLIGRDILNKINFEFKINSISNAHIDELVKKHSELFGNELGRYKYSKAKFEIREDAIPIFMKPRRIPLAFQSEIDAEIDRLIAEGVLAQVENSDWGTPIVPILKKNGKLRVCVDYKSTINPYLKDVKCTVPNIEDIFAALSGGVYFSKLDLRNAYNQIEVDEPSQSLLAWSTHRGVFACKRMSFGAKTACAIFQSIVSKVLQGVPNCVAFFDDILVTGRDLKEHLSNLDEVFRKLNAAGLKLNITKCEFLKEKVKYLGHVIDAIGCHKDEEKSKQSSTRRSHRT